MDSAGRSLGIRRLILELLTSNAVPTGLPPDPDVSVGFTTLEEGLDKGKMTFGSGPHETVVADSPAFPKVLVGAGDRVAVILRRHPPGRSCALNLLAVFINSRDEHDGFPLQSLEACKGVAGDRGVRAAEMGFVVDVVERGREAVGHLSAFCS